MALAMHMMGESTDPLKWSRQSLLSTLVSILPSPNLSTLGWSRHFCRFWLKDILCVCLSLSLSLGVSSGLVSQFKIVVGHVTR